MKRTFSFGLALAFFGIGALVGQLATNASHAQATKMADSGITAELAQEAGVTLGYLNTLRHGETEKAITLMENRLDAHIAKLGDELSALPASERNPQSLTVIRQYREYRAKYPHSPRTPAMKSSIEKAYSLLDSGSK